MEENGSRRKDGDTRGWLGEGRTCTDCVAGVDLWLLVMHASTSRGIYTGHMGPPPYSKNTDIRFCDMPHIVNTSVQYGTCKRCSVN